MVFPCQPSNPLEATTGTPAVAPQVLRLQRDMARDGGWGYLGYPKNGRMMIVISGSLYLLPRCSMYGIFTNIGPKNHPNAGTYTIHGAYGLYIYILYIWIIAEIFRMMCDYSGYRYIPRYFKGTEELLVSIGLIFFQVRWIEVTHMWIEPFNNW